MTEVNSADRQPRSRRASVGPSAAAYIVGALQRAGITAKTIRSEILWREQAGYTREAMELADAIDQLRWAARGVSATDLEPDISADRSASEVTPETDSGLVTTVKAADVLGVCPERVTQLIRAGTLRAARHGRSYLIDKADLMALRDLRKGSRAA